MSLTKSIVVATFLSALTSALPSRHHERQIPSVPSINFSLPKTGGPKDLSLNLPSLQHLTLVTIGRGIQNYTCPPGTTKPIQTSPNSGALAQLYDITSAINASQTFADALTTVSFFTERPMLALSTIESASEALSEGPIIVDSAATDKVSEITPLINEPQYPPVCFHYFNSENVPVFDCGDERGVFFGKRLDGVDAPVDAVTASSTSSSGSPAAKAIPWIILGQKEGFTSKGITKVLRVVTAGGAGPATCEDVGPEEVVSVDYAAQYWFFNEVGGA